MEDDKALGSDELSPRLLLQIAELLVEQLCIISNSTVAAGVVPEDWRISNVPISLTSQLWKVSEFIMRDILVNYRESHQLICDSQHGFRRGRSCQSNLLSLLEIATKTVDVGRPGQGI